MGKRQAKTEQNAKEKKGKILWIAGGIIGGAALLYVGIAVFFMSHFFINTKINGKDFSGKTSEAVEAYLQLRVKGYGLTILEKDGKKDVISGDEIHLEYQSEKEAEKLLLSLIHI